MSKIEIRTRKQISEFLPDAISTALLSYQTFSEREELEEPKAFKAHHDACKVAIAHIELLIKLAQWADLPDPDLEGKQHQDMLLGLIESAQGELNGYREDGKV
ncbi:MAG: hypothetical protein ACRBCK_04580 [Alphaproteobacteria bacterium]